MSRITLIIISIPFIILLGIISSTWVNILTTDYFATPKHYAALGAGFFNAVLYLYRYKYAVLITGLILILATFNQLALFPSIESTSYSITIRGNELSTPSIQVKSLMLLIVYLILISSFWRALMGEKAHTK